MVGSTVVSSSKKEAREIHGYPDFRHTRNGYKIAKIKLPGSNLRDATSGRITLMVMAGQLKFPQLNAIDPIKEERAGRVREVGSQAIWSLSSCKPGFGVDQLRDDCMDTYWQSDGQLPHLVNIQFRQKTTVSDISIYTDYKLDESYTPSRVSIRAGTNFNDLQEVDVVDLVEPTGWVVIPTIDVRERSIRTFMIQIAVISNHQNGRDTHMRQIKVHSPVDNRSLLANDIGNFVTVQCQQFTTLR